MERDRRGLRLSVGGALFTLVAFVLAIIATVSNHWATFSGGMNGNFGPWKVCFSDQRGCSSHTALKTTWASKVAGAGSAACTGLLAISLLMCPLLVAMHVTAAKTMVKFRHATLIKMVCTATAVLCGAISALLFLIEVYIFGIGRNSGASITLSWAFYIQLLTVVTGVLVGAGAGIEFSWSRKLGGDPTVYRRDPEGIAATTISNPYVKDPGNGHIPRGGRTRSSGRGNHHNLHQNSNGVKMTTLSGQPYMVTSRSNGHNGTTNGVTRNGVVAFDPNRTPGRSSLRRPKPAPAPSEDSTDSNMGIENLAFKQSSPTPKKKVRIHTQSTQV